MITRQPRKIEGDILDFIEEDEYVKNYEDIAKDDIVNKYTPDEVKDEILIFCPKDIEGVLMDIGCGNGYMLSRIKAWYKIAVDISMVNLRQVEADFKVRCNAENIPLINGLADYILCTDVFEHVIHEDKLCEEIIRLLKPKGKLILAVPFKQDLGVYDTEEYKKNYKQYKYLHMRSVDDETIFKHFMKLDFLEMHIITSGMKYMTIKPYPIKIYIYERPNT